MEKSHYSQEDAEYILMQLDNRRLPFAAYSLRRQEDGEHLMPILGRGGFAEVRSAGKRKNKGKNRGTGDWGEAKDYEKRTARLEAAKPGRKSYALKIIGFGKHGTMLSEEFFENAQVQMNMYLMQKNIVQIYDLAEVHLWLNRDFEITATKIFRNLEEVQAAKQGEAADPNYIDDRNLTFLALQFIVMEELIPIVVQGENGRPAINPAVPLNGDDETEFLKVAYDIGLALRYMYKEIGMLHRDIKPQNIFYDPRQKEYKLGDFGIAKITEDGLTGNADAYTRGYAAPEVLDCRAQKYDNTADIYSLGMTIYLLLNNMKFPAPPDEMYREDYVLPLPENPVWSLTEIVRKMCRYNPEERYQDMEDALHDIEDLAMSSGLGYKRKHATGEMILGLMLLLMGTVMAELAFYPSAEIHMTIPAYLLAGSCIYMGVKQCTDESWLYGWSTLVALVCGVYLLVTTGFHVWKLLLLLFAVLSPGALSLGLGGGILAADLTGRGIDAFLQDGAAFADIFADSRAAAVVLITFGVELLFETTLLKQRSRGDTWWLYKHGLYWVLMMVFYLGALFFRSENTIGITVTTFLLGADIVEFLLTLPLKGIGIAGIALCAAWMVRERVMRAVEENKAGAK